MSTKGWKNAQTHPSPINLIVDKGIEKRSDIRNLECYKVDHNFMEMNLTLLP